MCLLAKSYSFIVIREKYVTASHNSTYKNELRCIARGTILRESSDLEWPPRSVVERRGDVYSGRDIYAHYVYVNEMKIIEPRARRYCCCSGGDPSEKRVKRF